MTLRLTTRFIQLLIGLVMFGAGCAVMVKAGIGLDPWTVFAQGLSELTGIGIGWITNIVGFVVLLLWIPLRQRPGLGTVLNIALVGTSLQLTLPSLSTPDNYLVGVVMFLGGVGLVGLGSGLYIGARFGPGPRDGLMTGIHARWGWPIWVARTVVEVLVLGIGFALGGTIGLGTLLFAALIGPACHLALAVFDPKSRAGATDAKSRRGARDPKPRRGAKDSVLAELGPVASRPHM